MHYKTRKMIREYLEAKCPKPKKRWSALLNNGRGYSFSSGERSKLDGHLVVTCMTQTAGTIGNFSIEEKKS